MNWSQIITFFLSTTVITGGLVYIIKLFIDKFAESKLELYKSTLLKDTENFKHSLNLEVEKFRNELNITSIEHQIRYSKLYEERGQVIKKMYALLIELENSISGISNSFSNSDLAKLEENYNNANKSIYILKDELELNRIFFSEHLCNKIYSIWAISEEINLSVYLDSLKKVMKKGEEKPKNEMIDSMNKFKAFRDRVDIEIKSARLNLAEEFRKLIGVN